MMLMMVAVVVVERKKFKPKTHQNKLEAEYDAGACADGFGGGGDTGGDAGVGAGDDGAGDGVDDNGDCSVKWVAEMKNSPRGV